MATLLIKDAESLDDVCTVEQTNCGLGASPYILMVSFGLKERIGLVGWGPNSIAIERTGSSQPLSL
jgi:hypothetical protein